MIRGHAFFRKTDFHWISNVDFQVLNLGKSAEI